MKLTYHYCPFILVFVLALSSCVSKTNADASKLEDEIDPTTLLHSNLNGKQFSIPSPILTALLLKEINMPYNSSILIDKVAVEQKTTEYARSLYLGALAADLGYVSFYSDNSKTVHYLMNIEKLTTELGLDNSFNKNFIKRFQDNLSHTDSLIYLSAEAFKNADSYLKNNDRISTSSLILIGGWVESMYIASNLAKQTQNKEIIERIGEQKQTLETIISVLIDLDIKENNSELLNAFQILEKSYENVSMHYIYNEPSIDMDKKLTTLNHDITFDVPVKVLMDIQNKITAIRNLIVQ